MALLLVRPKRAWASAESLAEYIASREDLDTATQLSWARAVRRRFGGVSLDRETEASPEIGVAKAILSAAIFMDSDPRVAVDSAWEGWRSAMNQVPPPIAIHYQVLVLEGRPPKGRPIDLALNFPDYYVEEIAPDLVEWWEEALAEGRIPEALVPETEAALAATRRKMRPLLIDRLRLLVRLHRERRRARGARRAELRRNLQSLNADLRASFTGVAGPEILNPDRSPLERLRIALKDFRLRPTKEDRELLRPLPKDEAPARDEPDEGPVRRWLRRRRDEARERRETPPPPPPGPPPPPPRPRRGDNGDRGEDRGRSDRGRRDPPPPGGDNGDRRDRPSRPSGGGGERRSTPPPEREDRPRQGRDPSPSRKDQDRSSASSREGRRRGAPPKSHAEARRRLEAGLQVWMGTPYRWGGETPGVGTDCSGFTQGLFDQSFGVRLPRVSRDQYLCGSSVRRSSLRPGDLVFFDTEDRGRVNHVGVYLGAGRFAHASYSKGVIRSELDNPYYRRAYRGARRILSVS
ncbi:MAG: C40 family peptidase [Myxococcota bacterium]